MSPSLISLQSAALHEHQKALTLPKPFWQMLIAVLEPRIRSIKYTFQLLTSSGNATAKCSGTCQGECKGAAALMNRSLQPKGITVVKAAFKDSCFEILLESPKCRISKR